MTVKKIKPVVSQFDKVLVASVRVRELKRGYKPLIVVPGAGITVTAMTEIEQGLIGLEYLDKV